jgi:hypothetical protein
MKIDWSPDNAIIIELTPANFLAARGSIPPAASVYGYNGF